MGWVWSPAHSRFLMERAHCPGHGSRVIDERERSKGLEGAAEGAAEGARRGRLKLYVGYAAGVGKTWRMLEEARALRRGGVDVIGAIVEARGRADTVALVGDLELAPRRRIEFGGVAVEELDVSAILARKPSVALVDDIYRTNAPGAHNRRRFDDALEIVSAGIDVIGALDVQHIEGVNEIVQRITGVLVRDTIPDAFVDRADQVVTVDLDVEDLLERLREGKIYQTDRISWALQHLFREVHLAALRELMLREMAQIIERSARQRSSPTSPSSRSRLMVCLPSDGARALTLLLRASRLAGRLNTDWYAVLVAAPGAGDGRHHAVAERECGPAVERTRELGGEFVRLLSADPASAVLEFARTHRVRDVVLGCSRAHPMRGLLRRETLDRFLLRARGFDLHIVSFQEGVHP
jgi:two-component system sensor histidine kinase KdpD